MGSGEAVGAAPGLHLTLVHSSPGLSPQLLCALLRNTRRRRPGSALLAGGSLPPHSPAPVPSPSIRSPLSSQTGPHAPCLPRPGDGPSPPSPRPRTCGRESRGPHPGHRPLLPPSPSPGPARPADKGVQCVPSRLLSSRPARRPSAPGLPFPSLGPPEPWRWLWRVEGLLALTVRPVGSAAPLHIPGDLPPGTRGVEGCLRDGGFKIGMRGDPQA